MKKMLVGVLMVGAMVGVVNAATVTNRIGQSMTVTKLSETMAASTVAVDQSMAATRVGQIGVHVAHYKVTSGDTGAIDISLADLPKGAILLEGAVIEVNTAVTPATSTNALAVGGVTVLATGVTLNGTGIKQAVSTPGITTAADKVALTISGDPATAGEFTVYLPYLLGTAQ